MKQGFRVWLLVTIAWMMVIFWFSAQNADESSAMSGWVIDLLGFIFFQNQFLMDSASFIVRKGAHMSEYAILAMLLMGMYKETRYAHHSTGLALLTAVGYACSDEFHQLFVPGRAGRIQDVGIDFAGACIGVVLWLCLHHMISKRKENNSLKRSSELL